MRAGSYARALADGKDVNDTAPENVSSTSAQAPIRYIKDTLLTALDNAAYVRFRRPPGGHEKGPSLGDPTPVKAGYLGAVDQRGQR
jgi:hypothetical protein